MAELAIAWKKDWENVQEITELKEWERLKERNGLVPFRVVLVYKSIRQGDVDEFKGLHQDVKELIQRHDATSVALFVTVPWNVACDMNIVDDRYTATDAVVLLKGLIVCLRIPLGPPSPWGKVKEEIFKGMCLHVCLVIVGSASTPEEHEVFCKDIIQVSKFQCQLTEASACSAIYEAMKTSHHPSHSFYETFPVKRSTETSQWSHLLFSIDPSSSEVRQLLKNVLENPYFGWVDIVYCGHGSEDGDWILHDCDFTCHMFVDVAKECFQRRKRSAEVQSTGRLHLNCCYGGKWNDQMLAMDASSDNPIIRIRPIGEWKEIPLSGKYQYPIYETASRLLPSVNTCISRNPLPEPRTRSRLLPDTPTMVVFPAGDGDCSLFAYKDFCMLVDGGRSRGEICCWKYIRTLSTMKIDAIVVTHLDADHITGVGALLRLLNNSSVRLDLQSLYFNCPENVPVFEGRETTRSVREGEELLTEWGRLKKDTKPQPCLNNVAGGRLVKPESPNIVDRRLVRVQIVTPFIDKESAAIDEDEKAMLQFLQDWRAPENALSTGVGTSKVTMTNMVSIALLVTCKTEQQQRILYCGDAPKNRLLRGLEILGHNDLDVDILYVPHHGSRNNTDQEFFKRVRASVYVFSSNGQKHHHPDGVVVDNLVDAYEQWSDEQKGRHPHISLFPNYITKDNKQCWSDRTLPNCFKIENPIRGQYAPHKDGTSNKWTLQEADEQYDVAEVSLIDNTIEKFRL